MAFSKRNLSSGVLGAAGGFASLLATSGGCAGACGTCLRCSGAGILLIAAVLAKTRAAARSQTTPNNDTKTSQLTQVSTEDALN